ncbi:hypothetical protein LguiB_013322 [Lonicera macranthoides]
MANPTLKRSFFLSCFPTQFLRSIITPQSSTICRKHLLSTVSDSDKSLSSVSSFTVQYLMNTCGFPLQDALSASKKLQLNENKSHKHQSVLELLRSFHFYDTHITKLLIKSPKILQMKVNNNLKPKLEYLRDNGLEGRLLPDLIVSNPEILIRSLSGFTKPRLEFLKKYLHTNDKVFGAVKRTSWLWRLNLKGIMERNIELLLSEGVTTRSIERWVFWQPRTLMHRVDRIVYAIRTVKELGLDPSSLRCVRAIQVLLSISHSTWNQKVQNFKTLGWSEDMIWSAFKRDSMCFGLSEENVRRTMDFYMNTMKLKPEVIAAQPNLLAYAMNTRIRPRYSVIKVLECRKLLKKKFKVCWVFTLTEKDFLEKFVDKHLDQIPNLLEVYRGTIAVEKMDQLEQTTECPSQLLRTLTNLWSRESMPLATKGFCSLRDSTWGAPS